MRNVVDSKGKAARAFTLIELLVVIAVIALLVTMLMPTLRMAKHLARRSICAANTRSIATALHVYAGDHDGWLVPSPGRWMNCFHTYYVLYMNKPPHSWVHFGVLYDKGYLSHPEIMYCPGQNHPFHRYPEAWDDDWARRCGYLYGLFSQPAGGQEPRAEINLDEAPPSLGLAADVFTASASGDPVPWAHRQTGLGVTTVFVDGHAEYIPVDPAIYDVFESTISQDAYYRDLFAWSVWKVLEGDPTLMNRYFF